jgi:hypothetical protein
MTDAEFMAGYEQRMEQELQRSRMPASFDTSALRAATASTSTAADAAAARDVTGNGGDAAVAAAARADAKGKGKAMPKNEGVEDMGRAPGVSHASRKGFGSRGEDEDEDEELQPVDVDINLVQSLLASYSGQQGLPGPVSNLAGLMGISLPDDKDAHGKSPFDAFLS